MIEHNQYNFEQISNMLSKTSSYYNSNNSNEKAMYTVNVIDQAKLQQLLSNHAVSLTECLALTTKARFLVEAKAPYRVVYANRAWSELTGYSQNDIIGGELKALQGPLAGLPRISSMLKELEIFGHCEKDNMVSRRKDQSQYCCELEFHPVITQGADIHGSTETLSLPFYLATITQVPLQYGFSMYMYSRSGRSLVSKLTGDEETSNSSGEMSGVDQLNQLNLDKIPLLQHNSLIFRKKRSLDNIQEVASSGRKSVRSELSCSCASHDSYPFLSEYCSVAGSGSVTQSDDEQAALDSDVLANLLMDNSDNSNDNSNISNKRRRIRTTDSKLSYQES